MNRIRPHFFIQTTKGKKGVMPTTLLKPTLITVTDDLKIADRSVIALQLRVYLKTSPHS